MSRLAAMALLLALGLSCRMAAGGELPTGAELDRAVDEIVRTEKPPIALYGPVQRAIRALPNDQQLRFADRFLASPHWKARCHGVTILERQPTATALPRFRRLLDDEAPYIRRNAATWLVKKRTNDPRALRILMDDATSRDPKTALDPIIRLGRIESPDVHAFFAKLLGTEGLPTRILGTAMCAAAGSRAYACAPRLVELLDDRRPVEGSPDHRVCDIAAYALEMLYRINHSGTTKAQSIEERDAWIATWKAWYAAEGHLPPQTIQANYAIRLLDESLRTLQGSPPAPVRERIKRRLIAATGTAFCLGDLPGVDAIVAPSVRDLWRILQVHEPALWHKFRNAWESHQYVFKHEFLKAAKDRFKRPDRQAFEFLRFTHGSRNFSKVRVWGFCRDFAEVFPASEHVRAVTAIRKEAQDAIATTRNRIVLHGHIAVLEPVPRARERRPSMVPPYAAYLAERVHEEPSNWRLHQALIDHAAAARRRRELVPKAYAPLAGLSVLYPGNEWLFVAAAAYQLRVRGAHQEAAALASKALILNPGNAKAHALRGIIRMGMSKEHDGAAADLARAAKLDPKALGDEPETPRAAAFLIRKTREAGNARQARAWQKALAGLQPLHITHPIDDYRALTERP